jgi:hypothetical protein
MKAICSNDQIEIPDLSRIERHSTVGHSSLNGSDAVIEDCLDAALDRPIDRSRQFLRAEC